jgi:hypothetical protein
MNNIYHRYLKLPFEYPRPDHLLVKPETFYNSCVYLKDVLPDFISWVESYNCKLSNVIEIFYTPANGGAVPVHTDSGIKPGVHDPAKINFTWGPEDSVTRWWAITDERKLIKLFNHNKSQSNDDFQRKGIVPDICINANYIAKAADLVLAHEVVVNRPSLFNAGQLHSTFNANLTQDRWTLSFTPLTMDGNIISFSQALEIFKDCVDE